MPPRPLAACCIAEVLGTFLLIFLGCGAVHVGVLTGDLSGLWQGGIVWGIAIMLAVYVVGPISGAHINPAITLGLASWKLFPSGRVLPYLASQLLGAFLAAAVLFCLFQPHLEALERTKGIVRGEPGSEITAMCYGDYFPNPAVLAAGDEPYDAVAHADWNRRVSLATACLAEIFGTAILALVVVSVTEKANSQGPGNLAPVFIGLTVAALICVIAPLTQACFNPARDLGPRMMSFLAGWGPIAFPSPRGLSFILVYVVSPVAGAVMGVGLYQCLLKRYVLEASPATSSS